MTNRYSTGLFGAAAATLVGVAIATVLTAGAQSTPQPAGQAAPAGRGAAPPSPPCGPQGQLPANLSKNVDPRSRCFEVRIYTVDKARVEAGKLNVGINELHQRFREKELAIFKKHGAEIIGAWQQSNNPDTLVWMLAYRDSAHRDEVWAKFNADPDWAELRKKYPVPVSPNTFLMSASDYSPMK
jgi:hypothetical protein